MKNNLYSIIIIFGFIHLFLVAGCIWPLFTYIKKNSENLVSIKNDTVVLEKQNNEIENFKRNYEDYRPNLEKMNQLFTNPQNPVDLIKFVETIALDSGITPTISIVPATKQDSRHIITLQVFANADFLKLLAFSEALEHGPYLITIQSITMKKPENEKTAKNNPSGTVDAYFKIQAFAQQ